MTASSAIELTYQALVLVLVLSLPAVLASAAVGLLVGLLQAVTQIQDQSIAQAPKTIVVIVVIALTAGWAGGELFNFGQMLLRDVGST
jgi:type III secretion protein S